jgi:hypothetical protein
MLRPQGPELSRMAEKSATRLIEIQNLMANIMEILCRQTRTRNPHLRAGRRFDRARVSDRRRRTQTSRLGREDRLDAAPAVAQGRTGYDQRLIRDGLRPGRVSERGEPEQNNERRGRAR